MRVGAAEGEPQVCRSCKGQKQCSCAHSAPLPTRLTHAESHMVYPHVGRRVNILIGIFFFAQKFCHLVGL